jgi:hypothetical protein
LAAAVAVLLGVWLAVTVSTLAHAAAGCLVQYTPNTWPGGFTANITITNLGDPITGGWKLTWTYPGDQKVTQAWNATVSQTGQAVTLSSAAWNGELGSNVSVYPGVQGSYAGSNDSPASFALNGLVCTGTPTPTTTTPVPTTTTPVPTTPPGPDAAPVVKVSGNKLVTSSGAAYRLLGVNRSGGEFACIQGNGIWDGPMDAASIDAMRTWKVRTVRVPLNEECWLGTSNVKAEYGGAAYQAAVKAYVSLLTGKGITPILEMHWNYGQYTGNSSGCAETKASCQKPMPDAEYAPKFWTSVAQTFKGNDAVILDLFNEPYPERATGDATSGWKCWRDGGTCNGINYEVAGFQSLVDTVRATGATNVIMIGGLAYSNDASQWLDYMPKDPQNNVMAFAHVYNFNTCSNVACYESTFGKVAEKVPFAFTEIGENDCASSFVETLMNWADTKDIGYLGWTWNTWDCSTGPALISDYNGTPTNFGAGIQAHLLTVSN